MPKDCPFCHIAKGLAHADIVFEDEQVMAFVSWSPIRRGHLQVIPKQHFDYFDDLPEALAARILHLGQALAKGTKALYGVERVGFLFTGGDVKHVHAHVVPLYEKTDITSRRYIAEPEITFVPPFRLPSTEAAKVAAEIREACNLR